MSYHWDVELQIQCVNEEEANRLHSYLEEHNFEDDYVSFNTGCFGIGGNNFYFDVTENSIFIGDETRSRDIGSDNFNEFLDELDDLAAKANATIQNVILSFFSQENQGDYIFVKKLAPKAFEQFLKDYTDFDENETDEECIAEYKKEVAEAREEYKDARWVIVCDEDCIKKLVENDPDKRECLWEFHDEIICWVDRIINKFKFPWEEGCLMWIEAIDKDGESLWDNQ